jgi:quinol monooxygenase YgiN
VPLYIFARFEPRPGMERRLKDELAALLAPTRAEPGCARIHLFESTRPPAAFYVHSEWADQAAFDAHGEAPHIRRFFALVNELTTHPPQAVRTRQIG